MIPPKGQLGTTFLILLVPGRGGPMKLRWIPKMRRGDNILGTTTPNVLLLGFNAALDGGIPHPQVFYIFIVVG